MRRGFTIIELVMVIAILGILLGIVTTAAAGAIRQAREKKADACCAVVQAAFETYYAQKGEWPGDIELEGNTRMAIHVLTFRGFLSPAAAPSLEANAAQYAAVLDISPRKVRLGLISWWQSEERRKTPMDRG